MKGMSPSVRASDDGDGNGMLTSTCRIIEYINKHEGVEWMPLGDMAKEFLEGRMPGVDVEGGVDI